MERIAGLVNSDRIKGISSIRDESDLKEPVRLIIEIKRDADPEVVLNQLYQFSPLQDTISIILLALVDGKTPVVESQADAGRIHPASYRGDSSTYPVSCWPKARRRKHVVEGQLLALANIDEIIRIIRASKTQAEAKEQLMGVPCPAALMQESPGSERLCPVPGRARSPGHFIR